VENEVTRSSGTAAAQTDTDSILGISALLSFWIPSTSCPDLASTKCDTGEASKTVSFGFFKR
jgi:hypothetical protein